MQEIANNILIGLKEHSLYVYLLIFLISFSESFAFIGLVVPGAAFAVSSGFLAYKGYFSIYMLIIYAIFGAVLADIASFYLGTYSFDKFKKSKLYGKYRAYFEYGVEFFKKYGALSIFFGRFIGVLRPIVPFVAGSLDMKKNLFFVWAIVSGILWGVAYIGAGYFFGEGFELVKGYIKDVDYILISAILLILIVYLLKKRGKWSI
jgi:membrane protein DedA with SNARE-associated domain